MNVLTFDVGLAAKLKKAFAAHDWNEADINLLAESKDLPNIRQVLRGQATINVTPISIDCDAGPLLDQGLVANGFSVEEHLKGGHFTWHPSSVKLHLAEKQERNGYISGTELRAELRGKAVLNANVLDYLYKNQHLIPKEWAKNEIFDSRRRIFFWGSIFKNPKGKLYVRCLEHVCWDQWIMNSYTITDAFWDRNSPAAIYVTHSSI